MCTQIKNLCDKQNFNLETFVYFTKTEISMKVQFISAKLNILSLLQQNKITQSQQMYIVLIFCITITVLYYVRQKYNGHVTAPQKRNELGI